MSILITWKSEKYEINMIQEFGEQWETIKLSDLVKYISLKTKIPSNGIKLLCSGGKQDWESEVRGSFGFCFYY